MECSRQWWLLKDQVQAYFPSPLRTLPIFFAQLLPCWHILWQAWFWFCEWPEIARKNGKVSEMEGAVVNWTCVQCKYLDFLAVIIISVFDNHFQAILICVNLSLEGICRYMIRCKLYDCEQWIMDQIRSILPSSSSTSSAHEGFVGALKLTSVRNRRRSFTSNTITLYLQCINWHFVPIRSQNLAAWNFKQQQKNVTAIPRAFCVRSSAGNTSPLAAAFLKQVTPLMFWCGT